MNTKPILRIDNRTFAPGKRGMVDSLFVGPQSATGYYVECEQGISLYQPDGTLRAFLSARSGSRSRFFVTAHRTASGRPRYMFGLADSDREWLGLPKHSLLLEDDIGCEWCAALGR